MNLGRFWWSTGAYARVTDLGRSTQLGDIYGPMWVRTYHRPRVLTRASPLG